MRRPEEKLEDYLLSTSEQKRLLGNISDMCLWHREQCADFPPAVWINKRKYRWHSQMLQWIEQNSKAPA